MQAAAFLAVTVLLASSTRATEVNMSSQSTGEIKCGEDVTLHCRLSQNKVIKLEISQISNPATDSSTVLCKSTTNEVNAIGCRYIKGQDLALAIKAAAKSDNGTYICKEQNNLDHRNKTFNLHVTGCNSSQINLPDQWMMSVPVSLTVLLLILESGTVYK